MKKINLGCGNDIKEGWENYDYEERTDGVKNLDISKLPLPFPDNYADEILLKHVFEHLSCNKFQLMQELSRILKPDGKLTITVPILHKCVEHETTMFTPDYFNGIQSEFYGCLFKGVEVSTTNNKINDVVWKIKQFLFWVLKKEITYELKK